MSHPLLLPAHGGPDGGPPIAHDFSTNANPLGPPPALAEALLSTTDRGRYPDPQYQALRQLLGRAHGVAADLVLPSAGGAEAIRRLTLAALLQEGVSEVWVPQPGFGDYALAARALGLAVHCYPEDGLPSPGGPALLWICQPNNPSGLSLDGDRLAAIAAHGRVVAIDLAYQALRLDDRQTAPALPAGCWQLHSPNKALGLTGVRAGYLLAPAQDALWARLLALAPSWVLSAEGVTLLQAWPQAETQAWLAQCRAQLRCWKQQQRGMLAALGWQQRDAQSYTNFWLAQPPCPLPGLRQRGIKLREAASLGRPGWWRVAALPPASQQALLKELQSL